MTDLLSTTGGNRTDNDRAATENGGNIRHGIARTQEGADLLDALKELFEDTENANTQRTYRAGWTQFAAFADRLGFDALPAPVEGVVAWMLHLAKEGYAPSTIDTRLSAVTVRHENEGLTPPTSDPRVKKTRDRLNRKSDHSPDKVKPILMRHLRAMDFATGPDADANRMKALRDRALLYIGFAGGFRRSELVSLRVEDLHDVEGGAVLHLRSSKTDQEGKGRHVPIPEDVPGLPVDPLTALREWLDAAGIKSGPLFRGVDRWGNVRDAGLSGQAVYNVVKARMEAIGEDPSDYGAHSLRAGFVTQAYMDGVGEQETAQQTGHKKIDTLRGYQRVNVVMDSHPLTRMGTTDTDMSSDDMSSDPGADSSRADEDTAPPKRA